MVWISLRGESYTDVCWVSRTALSTVDSNSPKMSCLLLDNEKVRIGGVSRFTSVQVQLVMTEYKHHVQIHDDNSIYVVERIPPTPSTEPIIVLVPGLGDTSSVWSAVQRLLPTHLRTITYDRLNLGRSSLLPSPLHSESSPFASPKMRTASVLADELHDLLDIVLPPDLARRYLLVGSSYGTIISREFLQAHNDQVVGPVSIDGNQENTIEIRQWPSKAFGTFVTDEMDTYLITGLQESHDQCTEEEWSLVVSDRDCARSEGWRGSLLEEKGCVESLTTLGSYGQLRNCMLGDRPLSIIVANLTRDLDRLFQASMERRRRHPVRAARSIAGSGTAIDTDNEEEEEDENEDEDNIEVVSRFLERLPTVEMGLQKEVLSPSRNSNFVYAAESGHLVPLWNPQLCVDQITWCLGDLEGHIGEVSGEVGESRGRICGNVKPAQCPIDLRS